MRQGQPCNHPGCVAHVSHPCEGCGRYAAGLANGPDVAAAKKRIVELSRTDSTIRGALTLGQQNGWTWDQTLSFLVIELQREKSDIVAGWKLYAQQLPRQF